MSAAHKADASELATISIMRIVILSAWQFLPPFCGTRRTVYDTASDLGKLGHQVLLLITNSGKGFRSINFECKVIKTNSALLEGFFLLGRAANRTLPSIWGPFANILRTNIVAASALPRIQSEVQFFRPDVILAEDPYVASVASRISRRLRIPLVYRVHHLYSSQHSSLIGLSSHWEFSILRQANRLVTFTVADQRLLRNKFGLDSEYVPIEPNPLPKNKPESREAQGYALYVSSYLGEEKEWIVALAENHPEIPILFAGMGSKTTTALPSNVIRVGIVSEAELSKLYDGCSFIFFPLAWRPGQGIPIKLLEALRTDKPILMNSRSSWLLPSETSGVFSFVEESDMNLIARMLSTSNATYRRAETTLGFASCSFDLEQVLEASQLQRPS